MSVLGICAFFYILKDLLGVVVFQRSDGEMWKVGYVRPGYMCILLYVKFIWCSGIPYDLWSNMELGGVYVCA